MAWKNIGYMNPGKAEYTRDWDDYLFGGYDSLGGKITLNIEFDKDSTNCTSALCRFRLNCPNDTENSWNLYYVLINPISESKPGTLIKLKGTWTEYSAPKDFNYYSTTYANHTDTSNKGTFTLTKNSGDATFKMPPIWIINDGQGNYSGRKATAKAMYKAYTAGGSRYTYTDALVAKYGELKLDAGKSYVSSSVGEGSVTITDNGDNSCTITAKAGTKGTNNAVKGATLQYSLGMSLITGCTKEKFTTEQLTTGLTTKFEIPTEDYDKDVNNFYVTAKVATKGTYGGEVFSDTVTQEIKHYVAPKAPGTPEISYTKNRLTAREDWTFNWTQAEANNDNSPVAGYRLTLLKNNQPVPATLSPGTAGYLIPSSFTTNVYTDILGVDNCSITLNPADFNFKKGETVCLAVKAFSRNNSLENPKKLFSTVKSSSHYVVESAGTVKVKVGDTGGNEVWTDGQVFVKVADTEGNEVWVEADDIMIKVADTEGNEVWVTAE